MRIGDYVRAKVNDYERNTVIITKLNHFTYNNLISVEDSELLLDNESIIKSSPNIIDILEVGDYVNGERVINIMKKHEYLEVSDEEITIDKEDIKSIVTKEQFKDIEYKVDGGN